MTSRIPERTSERPPRRDFLWRNLFPRGLFPKIFGWFLAAQLLLALALYLVALTTQRGLDQRFSEMIGEGLEARVRAAAIAYENGGTTAVQEAWPSAPTDLLRPGLETRDAQRQDTARPTAERPSAERPRAERSAQGRNLQRGRARGWGRRARNDIETSALFLLDTSASTLLARHLAGPMAPATRFVVPAGLVPGETRIFPQGGTNYLLRRVDTAHGGRFLGAVALRQGGGRPRGPLDAWLGGPGGGRGNGPLWRILVTAITMGALCFALARYLTDPAIKLRRATRSFAAGDFSTRVGPQMGQRRDELADLGRDFDQMAERIEGLLLAQRRLLGDISHELRSPLTRLSLALELALDTADEPTRSYLNRIESEVSELGGLIGQLLTLTRLENTSLDATSQSRDAAYLDLAHLVEHVAQNADFEAKTRDGSVEIVRSEACQVVGNGELLHSALENVVRNAILHSPNAPLVEISLQIETGPKPNSSLSLGQAKRENKAPRVAVIRVRDHGPGVPEPALELLFRPFYRVAEGRERQSGGTGLGLSIAQRAARFHGGDVCARNVEGGGLEVEISLPLSDVNADVNTDISAEPSSD